MERDLETFLTALYVIVDDVYQSHIRPQMPACGGPPALMSDSEVLCLGLAAPYGVRMLMVINQEGVATGWTLASGNVQERWVAELLFSTRAGVPGVQGPRDAQTQNPGDTTHGMDGSPPELWHGVTQAHPER